MQVCMHAYLRSPKRDMVVGRKKLDGRNNKKSILVLRSHKKL